MGQPIIAEARGLTKRFGTTVALDDVSMSIATGETHALVGRNGAGKSTLVSLLTGLTGADAGSVLFNGEPAPSLTDRDGWRRRVACVYQHSTIINTLSVAENLFLNRQSGHGPISWPRLRKRAAELLESYDVDVKPGQLAADLTVEQRQMVEVARALSHGARFVIMDEPTAQLDGAGIARLFGKIRGLQERGVTFCYISHHLEEIYQLCQRVTVLRDARHVITAPVDELDTDALVAAMTGPDASRAGHLRGERTAVTARKTGAKALAVRNLSLTGSYADVSFDVAPGEIVGIAGAAGSGAVQLAETLAGMRAPTGGSVEAAGKRVRPGSVPAALKAGIGFVPEDRRATGFVPGMSVAENVTMTIWDRLGSAGFVSPKARAEHARQAIESLDIKTPSVGLPLTGLSGGNQQKVVMARALASEPEVLVLIGPTAGVDVRAKETLLAAVDDAAAAGKAAVIVSDELDDLRGCDRVLVMFAGRVTDERARGWQDADLVAGMEGVSDVIG
ncbi:sugar ABC transporter ATP-binding protein [Fodinicola acaciae]|uniref:sugar ABC transporter ATP-binding protein n=1 Tax=Fodinicola acaciae TaxID=2681555 RepID=UPI0013CF90BB|nr:sugar ABC transporter ATP-binding protein [Fodinicola acaciae]